MSSDTPPSPPPAPTGGFVTTEWSIVLATGGDPAVKQAALERLCRTYWQPVYGFIRQLGNDAETAKDMTQAFFVHLLASEFFGTADPERGRFRSYLRQACRLFLGNEWQKRTAQKRGGGASVVPWEQLTPEHESQLGQSTDPSREFDRQWALALLRSALTRLQQEYAAAGDERLFAALQPYLTARPAAGDYERLAAALGVARGTVPVLVHRLGKRYQELVRAEVAATLGTRTEVDEELRHCLAALGG